MNIKDLTKEVEEVSKIYSKRFNIDRDGNWFVLKLQEEMGELIQSYLMMIKQGRHKGKTVEEIKDMKKILEYPILTTPGLVIDEKVVSFGKVLSKNEVVKLLAGTISK